MVKSRCRLLMASCISFPSIQLDISIQLRNEKQARSLYYNPVHKRIGGKEHGDGSGASKSIGTVLRRGDRHDPNFVEQRRRGQSRDCPLFHALDLAVGEHGTDPALPYFE